jgi:hypothetical protein
MNNTGRTLLILTVAASIFLIITLTGSMLYTVNQEPDNNGAKPKEPNLEDILNTVLDYIEAQHPEVADFHQEKGSWNKTKFEGDTCCYYIQDEWTALISRGSTDEDFIVAVSHEAGVYWEGFTENRMVREVSYHFNQNISNNQDLRQNVMIFLLNNHPELSEEMGDPCGYTWEQTGSKILQGYSEFTYKGGDWEMTVGYPITSTEYQIYEIQLNNEEIGLRWSGVVKKGAIKEISYKR